MIYFECFLTYLQKSPAQINRFGQKSWDLGKLLTSYILPNYI